MLFWALLFGGALLILLIAGIVNESFCEVLDYAAKTWFFNPDKFEPLKEHLLLYLRWYDENGKRIRLKAKQRKLLREKAVAEFERVLVHTEPHGYRLGDD